MGWRDGGEAPLTSTADRSSPAASRHAAARRPADVGITAWLVIGVLTAFWTWQRWTPSGVSWHFFPEGARLLFGADALHLYAGHPELQIGPLTFVAVGPLMALPPRAALVIAQLVATLGAPLALWLLAPLAGPPGRRRDTRLMLAAALLLPAWTVLSVRYLHPDDVLATVLAVAAVRAVAAERAVTAGFLIGAAIAAKPWAVGFVPLLLGLPRRDLLRGAGTALAVGAAAWLPFLAADRGTVAAMHPPVAIADSSGLRLAGVQAQTVPGWIRTAQFVLAPVVAALVAGRRRWPGVLLVAVAVRMALDPQDNAYYQGSAVMAAVVADLTLSRRLVPWLTVVTSVLLWQPFIAAYPHWQETAHGPELWWFEHPQAVAALHLAWAVLVVAGLRLGPLVPDRHDRGQERTERPSVRTDGLFQA